METKDFLNVLFGCFIPRMPKENYACPPFTDVRPKGKRLDVCRHILQQLQSTSAY